MVERYQRKRSGRSLWVTSLATAGLVGVGAIGSYTFQSQSEKGRSLQNRQSVGEGIFEERLEPFPPPTPSSEEPASAPSSKFVFEEPKGGAAQEEVAKKRVPLGGLTIQNAPRLPAKATHGLPPKDGPTLSEDSPSLSMEDVPSVVGQEVPYEEVIVHFATDREQIDLSSVLLWTRIAFPAGIGLLVCCVMLVGTFRSKERWVWGVGFSLSAILTILFLHHAMVYGQQAQRLAKTGSPVFGTRRYEANHGYPLHLGTGYVTLPKSHRRGTVERPDLRWFEFSEDPEKHVMVQRAELRSEEDFFAEIKKSMDDVHRSSALVFIHGYNVQFADALMRTAQIKKDLEFHGPTILYSWPSHGDLLSYRRDGDNAAWTIAHLEQFLVDVKQRSGVQDLHVIAHSMGNRAIVGALEKIAVTPNVPQPFLNQLIMAAPDVDLSEFKELYSRAVDTTTLQTTLYTSSTDRALVASMKIHGYPRLGLSSGVPPQFAGIDTVEVSPIDPSLLGHSYYGSHPLLIRDLKAIIELGQSPSLRNWLIPYSEKRDRVAWKFSPRIAAEASLQQR